MARSSGRSNARTDLPRRIDHSLAGLTSFTAVSESVVPDSIVHLVCTRDRSQTRMDPDDDIWRQCIKR